MAWVTEALEQLIARGHNLAAAEVLYRSATEVQVVNSNVETALLTQFISAQTVTADRALRIRSFGDYKQNSGGAMNWRIRLALNGNAMWDSGNMSIADDADRAPFLFDLMLCAINSDAVQLLSGLFVLSAQVAPTTGEGVITTAPKSGVILGTGAEDMTLDSVITMTIEMAMADAAADMTMKYVSVELL